MKKKLHYLTGMFCELLPVFSLTLCLTICSLTAIAQAPATPTDFHTAQVGYTLELHWTDNADNETSYAIQKEWEDFYSYSERIDLPANTEMYVDTNVKPNLEYHYSLWAENETGPSTEVNLVGVVNVATPPAPTNVAAAPGPLMSIAVSFTDNSDMETYYEIHHTSVPDDYYGLKTINGGALDSTITAYISTAPYNVSGPPMPDEVFYFANTLVYVKVRAVINDNGTLIYGPFSPVVTALTNPVPAVATNFIASTQGNDIHLTWTDNSISEAAYFIAKFEGEFNHNDITLIRLQPNTTEYTDVNVSHNIQYHYWLIAIDDFELRAMPPEYWPELFFNDERLAKTSATILELPAVPLNVTATPLSPTSILVTFVDNSDVEFWYELLVTMSADDSTGVPIEGSGFGIGSVTEMELQDLIPGTTYYFRVRGVLELNNTVMFGQYSQVISASTPSVIPDPPVAQSATSLTAKSFIANWSEVQGATSYELDVFDTKNGTYIQGYEGKIVYDTYATVVITKKSVQHYSYLIRAVNEFGEESGNSNIIDVGKIKNASFAEGETLNENELSGLSISQYPNPVVNKFQVLVTSPDEPIAELQIMNLQGSRILSQTIHTNVLHELDATAYPAGMYVLKAVIGRSVRMAKMIKEE
jgi:hypothetical protein